MTAVIGGKSSDGIWFTQTIAILTAVLGIPVSQGADLWGRKVFLVYLTAFGSIGSIIVGSQPFIKKARWFRKSIGGGARQTGVFSAAARIALDETFGTDPQGQTGKLPATHAKAKRVAEIWTSRGGKLQYPVHTNMVWLDLEASGVGPNDLTLIGKEKGLRLLGGRVVVHYRE